MKIDFDLIMMSDKQLLKLARTCVKLYNSTNMKEYQIRLKKTSY